MGVNGIDSQAIQNAASPNDLPPPVFCGGLPNNCFRDDLRAWAEVYGPCKKVTVKMDIHTHRSRGFGFVEFETWDSFKALVDAPNPEETHVIQGKKIEVKLFDPESANASKTVKFSDPPTEDELTLFVGGLPASCDETVLQNFGALFGPVDTATVKIDFETGRSRGFGFIKFVDKSAVASACGNFDSNAIDEKWVDVRQVAQKFGKWGKGKWGKGGKKGGFGYKGPIPVWDGYQWVQMVPYGCGNGKGKGKYAPY